MNNSLELSVKNKIYTIRGKQVMLDRDLAELYEVETRILNQAVKRNMERFPAEFMFQLTKDEFNYWISQIVISNKEKMGLRKFPFVFTEQGVSMLSAVLKSKKAIQVSIQIINAFLEMRKFLNSNALIFQRLDNLEKKQTKFEEIFNALETKEVLPEKGIFFDGQIFDAYKFVADIIRKAKKSIVLIDNFIDDRTFVLLNKRAENVQATIYTKFISKDLRLDLQKHNAQYPKIEIKQFTHSHDRFIILDDNEVYHFGSSLKDLGGKWVAFSKFDKESIQLLDKLKK